MRLRVALLASFLVSGCAQHEVVWRGTATLGDSAVRFASRTALRPVGQSRSVCITPVNEAPGNSLPVQLDVYLVRSDGGKERLGWREDTSFVHGPPVLTVSPDTARWIPPDTVSVSPPAPPRMRDLGGEWCAEDWNGSHMFTRYAAVEISSPVRLRITKVRWASATPIAF